MTNAPGFLPMTANDDPLARRALVAWKHRLCGSSVGEVLTATVSPAVANVVFGATGRRIRRLPIKAPDVSPER